MAELIRLHSAERILTPVRIEFVAGAKSSRELSLMQAYLSEFRIADHGRILDEDWIRALHFAQRVPRDGKPRQLGDCLIRAIAVRLRLEVVTLDSFFPT